MSYNRFTKRDLMDIELKKRIDKEKKYDELVKRLRTLYLHVTLWGNTIESGGEAAEVIEDISCCIQNIFYDILNEDLEKEV